MEILTEKLFFHFVVFFQEWKECKNPQFNFSSQDLGILEGNFFKWDGKVTKIRYYTYFSTEFGKISFLFERSYYVYKKVAAAKLTMLQFKTMYYTTILMD